MKRPLFTGAFLLVLGIWILHSLIGIDFFPQKVHAGEACTLSGTLLKTEEKSSSFYLYLKNASCFLDEGRVRVGNVLLLVPKEGSNIGELLPGNVIRADVLCEEFRVARNEGNYDEGDYYHSLGVSGKYRLDGDLLILSRKVYPIRCAMLWLKERLLGSITSLVNGTANHAEIFTAILTGDRSGLDAETKDLYRKSGIAHILAISGLHISFIGMSLFSFLRKRMRFLFAALISGSVMICFCIMSGESASAVRATLMFLIRLVALKFGKSFDLLSALGLSAIFLLLSNPMYLYHSGFQLSFSAIIGIGLVMPALREFMFLIRNKTDENPMFWTKALEAFLMSFSVTLTTLPVIINTYYEIPVLSVLLNLVVVPLMGVVLESGVIGVLLGLVSLFLGRMLIGAGVYLISFIELLCAIYDKVPFSILITGHWSGWKIALYLVLLGTLVFLPNVRTVLKSRLPSIIALGGICIILALLLIRPADSSLHITFFDVDQGESILIESPSGANYLIDSGSASVTELYRYRMESALKYRGIRTIDFVIVTHPDTDHISAVISMLEDTGAGHIKIKNLALPSMPENEHYQMLLQKAKEAEVNLIMLHRGVRLEDSELRFSCLHPDTDFQSSEANAYSAVLQLDYQGFRALFTGDLGAEEERLLIREGLLSDCDLLKVAHHGSRFSTTAAFLEAVKPEFAVVSAGVHNSYGHPHPDVIKRLEESGAEIYVTAESGEIEAVISRDGEASVTTLLSAA